MSMCLLTRMISNSSRSAETGQVCISVVYALSSDPRWCVASQLTLSRLSSSRLHILAFPFTISVSQNEIGLFSGSQRGKAKSGTKEARVQKQAEKEEKRKQREETEKMRTEGK